ncbi:MAG: AraC family transcriptional regulator [Sphingomicrobium sp.]
MIRRINEMTAADTPRRPSRIVEETIAAPFAAALVDLAVATGANRCKLLERTGISAAALQDQHSRIPVAQWVALIRAGKEATGDPALALHFGEAFDVGDLSVLGLMGRSAATKEEGFELLNRFSRLVIDVQTEGEDRFELNEGGADGTWMIDMRLNPNECPEISEAGFAQMASMGRRMLPGVRHFKAVHFTHPEPAYRSEYDRIFQAPIVFDSDRNAFLMPEGWEAERIALQPHYALDIFGAHAEEVLERIDSAAPVRSRVEQLLAAMLSGGSPSAAVVADAVGLTEQTLYRRLKTEGFTFEQVLEDLRHKLATHYLRDKKLSAKDTSYRLGFSDPSAFSRAFKRWTGMSPTSFRRAA